MGEREKSDRFMGKENLKFLTRVGAMNCSRRRQSALIFFAGRWRGLTSAATRFMERKNLKLLTRIVTMNRSRRRQSALISFAGRWRGLTSAATRFMESENLRFLRRIVTMNRSGPSPQPSPIRWEREAIGRVRASFGGPVRFHGAGFLRLRAIGAGLVSEMFARRGLSALLMRAGSA